MTVSLVKSYAPATIVRRVPSVDVRAAAHRARHSGNLPHLSVNPDDFVNPVQVEGTNLWRAARVDPGY